jgi:thiol-disulfide isomerase/thioredoxin
MRYSIGRIGVSVILGAVAAFLVPALPAAAQPGDAKAPTPAVKPLAVGDKAPELKIAKWVKGEEVRSFEKGTVYVVEFWATWCSPCRKSIPHLTELQKQCKDQKVKIIGVSIWEEAGALDRDVTPFVQSMGDKMVYSVGYGGDDAEMARTWMEAAGRTGIPSAFVVNQEGVVAWMGHPMKGMDDVIKAVVAGTYDPKAAAADSADKEKKIRQTGAKLQEAMDAGNHARAIELMDEMIALDAKAFINLAGFKFKAMLVDLKNTDGAYAYAREVSGGIAKDSAQVLNMISWTIMDEAGVEKRDYDLAMELAVKADTLSNHQDAAITDTLARAYFEKGDVAKAVEVQQKAVSLASDDALKAELEGTLEKYRKALAEKK